MTALVIGRQIGTAPPNAVENGTPGGSGLEMTSSAGALEDTVTKSSGDAASSDGTVYEASFVHRAT